MAQSVFSYTVTLVLRDEPAAAPDCIPNKGN